jgi:hypothetical protein
VHQGETYNGNVFELPVTWVTKCPEKGRLTVTYSRFGRLRDCMCRYSQTRASSGPNRKFMLESVRQALRSRVVLTPHLPSHLRGACRVFYGHVLSSRLSRSPPPSRCSKRHSPNKAGGARKCSSARASANACNLTKRRALLSRGRGGGGGLSWEDIEASARLQVRQLYESAIQNRVVSLQPVCVTTNH